MLAVLQGTAGVHADDVAINTPEVLAALKGEWVCDADPPNGKRQRPRFDGSRGGDWQQQRFSEPISMTLYVEGRELLIQHYSAPKGDSNYRLRQLRFRYTLDKDSLTLARAGKTETWESEGPQAGVNGAKK